MNVKELKSVLFPELNRVLSGMVIEAEQTGEKPTGTHATVKITSPYIKDVGQAEEKGVDGITYHLERSESYKVTLSFTTYDYDEAKSLSLAQEIFDWFDFEGSFFLDDNDIVVVEKTTIDNRDAFVMNEYERRNGFDVILRISRTMTHDVEYIEKVEGISK